MSRKSNSVPSQYGTTRNVNLADIENAAGEDELEPEIPSTEPEPDDDQEEDSEKPDLYDFQGRQARMMVHYNVNNVTTLSRLLKGVSLECLEPVGEIDRSVGKDLAVG